MAETITACQNVCTDFSWVTPLTDWLRNLAIVVGVFVGWRQIDSWRREKVAVKRGELGEELIALTEELRIKIRSLRSAVGFGAPDGEEDDGTYDYRRRLRELAELDEEFGKLRQLKVRQRAFFGLEDVDAAVEAFFDARMKLLRALRGKIFAIRGELRFGERNPQAAERNQRHDEVIWEDYALGVDDGAVDPINSLIDPACDVVEQRMVPYIRLEISR